ncbi:MAG TPA: hypothetical protein VNT20_08310 [Flavisolibacter sp.]|jgi:hypothetical protein|nr:hypothetical protein [Flavisolibacter sp.]
MQLQNYFYINGIPYEHLSFSEQNEIDRLIERIKLDHLFERIALYQDHYFNIQESGNLQSKKQFESDLPDDLTMDLIKAYLKTKGQIPSIN